VRGARLASRRDKVGLYSSTFLFSLSLAMASVALPLVAVDAGYHASEVGVLVALSALAQIVMRWCLGGVMRRVSDTWIVTAAAVSLGISNSLVVASTALVPMVAASLVQGVSRACFWTGSQTHLVRRDERAASPIAWLNLIASAAMVAGPATAGVIADLSTRLAFGVAAAVGFVAAVPTLAMERPLPFAATHSLDRRGFMRRPGVAMGVSANAVAGAWRGILGSYVPVALQAAGSSGATIGVVVTVANSAATAGSFAAARLPPRWDRTSLLVGTVLAGSTTTVVGFDRFGPVAVALALALGGLGTGPLQVLGVTVASQSVPLHLRGDAVAVTGTLRALALFISPISIAALLPLIGLGAAVAVVSATMLLPLPLIARAGRSVPADTGVAPHPPGLRIQRPAEADDTFPVTPRAP
jgi:MFS family permease